MRTLAFVLAATLFLAAPVSVQSADVTWKAAKTAPETPEENRAHAEGRAIDINEVNKMPVSLAIDKSAPAERRDVVRGGLNRLEALARADVEVKAFVSPIGGFHRDPKTRSILREASQAELGAHWDHVHIETFD